MLSNITDINMQRQEIAKIIAGCIWDTYAANFMDFSNDRKGADRLIYHKNVGALFERVGMDTITINNGPSDISSVDVAGFFVDNQPLVRSYLAQFTKELSLWITVEIANDYSLRINTTPMHPQIIKNFPACSANSLTVSVPDQ